MDQVELILPKELYEAVKDELKVRIPEPVYSRVIMSLSSLLEGAFFEEYIKKGSLPIPEIR